MKRIDIELDAFFIKSVIFRQTNGYYNRLSDLNQSTSEMLRAFQLIQQIKHMQPLNPTFQSKRTPKSRTPLVKRSNSTKIYKEIKTNVSNQFLNDVYPKLNLEIPYHLTGIKIKSSQISRLVKPDCIHQLECFESLQQKSKQQVNPYSDDEPLLESSLPPSPYDLSSSLSVKLIPLLPTYSLLQPRRMPILLSLKSKDQTNLQVDRPPIDLICVIDVSGSMSDGSSTKLDKLGFVHLTLKALLQNLQEKDRLALVKFNKMGERLTSLMGNTEFNRNIFRKRVEELHAGGGTSIVSGMREAFRILKGRRQSNPVTSIFLLTDGMEKNADMEIKQLLKEMDMENDNFTIHSFGFGSDHQEKVLLKICKQKNGNFFFIKQPSRITQSFAIALGGLLSTVGLNASITVRNICPLPVMFFHGPYPPIVPSTPLSLALNHLCAGLQNVYLIYMFIDKQPLRDQQRSVNVLSVEVRVQDKIGKEVVKEETLWMGFSEEKWQEEVNATVMAHVLRERAAKVMNTAAQMAATGNNEEAIMIIEDIIQKIESNKAVDKESMKPILKQLRNSKHDCNPVFYQQYGKKNLACNAESCKNYTANLDNIGYHLTNVAISTMADRLKQTYPQSAELL